jgi:high-affinity K+ transport system ATPase subunit B
MRCRCPAFANYSLPFLPSAANWNMLTVTGTGVTAAPGAAAVIGGPAAGNLTGNITGAGVVVTYGEGGMAITGGGTHNIDNFSIRESSRPGDVNLDTFIDLADLMIIRQNFRQSVGSITQGDLTSDGFVNFDDFRLWKNNYIPAAGETVAGVPEPTGAILAAIAVAALRRRRRRAGSPA